MGLDRKLQYHSATGCCICGTKTSSSRFTSSERFESLFAPCFGLSYDDRRAGDICNACVLIVKRFRSNPRDSRKNWAHIIGSKVGPGHRSARRQKLARHRDGIGSGGAAGGGVPGSTGCKHLPHGGPVTKPAHSRRTPSPMRLRHPKRFTIKRDAAKGKGAYGVGSKYRSITRGSGRRAKVFRRRPTRRSLSLAAAGDQLIDTDYWKRLTICCGSVYKCESNDLILIDVAKYKPCEHRRNGLAHMAAVARDIELAGDDVVSSSSSVSSGSSAGRSSASRREVEDYREILQPEASPPCSVRCSAAAEECGGEVDGDREQMRGSRDDFPMDSVVPDPEVEVATEPSVAAAGRSILCSLLWNRRQHTYTKSDTDAENQASGFVWPKVQSPSVSIWPSSPISMPKSSPVKVFP